MPVTDYRIHETIADDHDSNECKLKCQELIDIDDNVNFSFRISKRDYIRKLFDKILAACYGERIQLII